MSGLLFFRSMDFFISKGAQGKVLCHHIPSFSLILFYSTQSEHCSELLSIFKRLPGTIQNCQFGIINISSPDGYNVVKMMRETIHPMKFVPFVILFINGRPAISYNGPRDEKYIRQFVVETANRIQSRKSILNNGNTPNNKKSKIPDYSLGVPIMTEDETAFYLKEKDLAKLPQQQRRM